MSFKNGKFYRRLQSLFFDRYWNASYSQEGEDIILGRLFEGKSSGFYVDVGAHHPSRFSNTYFFYKLGWRGINIDAMPGSMKRFDNVRPRDINIESPVSNVSEIMDFYIFDEPALNSFSKELSLERAAVGKYVIQTIEKIRTKTLDDILSEHLPHGVQIDFLTIDVEGLDFNVLQSITLDKYQPRVILIEMLSKTVEEAMSAEIYRYLKAAGYSLIANTVNTFIFQRDNCL